MMSLPPPPWVVAHRGASGERLENSIAACQLAVEQGAPALEVDVQLAADGELVVFHDWDLTRLGASTPAGVDRRVVERLTSHELRAVSLSWVREDGGGALHGVAPTLGELLAALPVGFPVDLELKRREADRAAFAAAFVAAVGARHNTLASSFDWELLAAVRARAPALPLAPLESRRAGALLRAGEELGAWSLHVHRRLATPELVAAAASVGRPLLVYTINDAADARQLFAAGVAGVFTDWPAQLLRAVAPSC
jgi:glycerophosphoryl diester phosphodiesterase